MSSTGRARGRARNRPDGTPLTPMPSGSGGDGVGSSSYSGLPTGASLLPAHSAYPSQTIRAASPQPPPQRAPVPPPESGRGRGLTTSEQQAAAGGVTATAAAPGGISPTGGHSSDSPNDSPPQQHSPPQITTGQGRAALRGAVNQPGIVARAVIIDEMDRLRLQDTGDVAVQEAPRREFRIESVFATRPVTCTNKVGTMGTPIRILCNYFEVISQPNWVLYQYHVDFNPPTESKRMRIGMMKSQCAELFPTNNAFDGSTLYSLTKLHKEITEVTVKRLTDDQPVTLKIKRVNEIVPNTPSFVHLFNVIFRRCLKLYGMKEIDHNYYDLRQKIPIPQYGLELISGFSTSIATYEDRMLLCAELSHKLLHKNTVYNQMNTLYNQAPSLQGFQDRCISDFVGKIIMTTYNDKTYKIDDIDFTQSPQSTFEVNKRGETTRVSFIEYYKTQHDIAIKDPKQPLLVSLPSAKDKRRGQTLPILLIPELCIVTGVDEAMRTDHHFKKAIEQFSKFGPSERCNKLSKFVDTFNKNEKVSEELNKWRINFSTQPVELEGRCFAPEELAFGNNITRVLNEKADWSNEMKGTPLLAPVKLLKWLIIYPQSKKHSACSFVDTYGQVIRTMGIYAELPTDISIGNDNPESYINALKQNISDGVQMVVVILTSKRKDRYDAIKRICCLEKPVPSQVITSNIIDDEKKKRSVITKVAIQMNCKLGGEIWQIAVPIKNVMICGVDTYHDTQQKNRSVCAFIATSNAKQTRFFSRATLQETHQELSNNLSITVKSSIDHYHKVNGVYPEKLIIYRDGVGDGQLEMVHDYEIPQIIKAFAMIDPNYRPLLTFIVVKKRGNARFFLKSQNGLSNPPCGTVIDKAVTRAEWFDFYLISQHVTQGTVNPTHYNVIYETMGLKPDHYQKLSFKLTHMYYNWPGTIRVPAPCQYAHKLAFLVGNSLHKEHHTTLCDKLYYL